MPTVTLSSLEAMDACAQEWASRLHPYDCLALHGDMGAGKTAFARALIRALSSKAVEVPSPTYTLAQHYDIHLHGAPCRLTHFDLYRVKKAEELDDIGFGEALEDGVVLVEWPDIAALPDSALHLKFSVVDESTRRVEW